MPALTPARSAMPWTRHDPEDVLEVIRALVREHQIPPTIREIGAACGITSTGHVIYLLDSLERRGLIERRREVARGIRVVSGECWCPNCGDRHPAAG